MNQISHKQAIQWIDCRLDDLLTKKQLSLLDEHLHSCTSCRAYAAQMDQLPIQLQSEFHARWDEQPVPSQKIIQQVTTKARNIPMKNRTYSVSELFSGAILLIVLAFAINFVVSQLRNTFKTANGTEVAGAPLRAQGQLIAFVSTQSGNSDIYTMHTDGSGLTNLTNDPGEDIYPVWSPDGNRIAFISNREGSDQLYVMDADGSDLTRLTEEPVSTTAPFIAINTRPSGTKDVLPIWSPDGTKIAYAAQDPIGNVSNIYTVDMTGQTHRLTIDMTTGQDYRLSDGLPETAEIWPGAWSADSQYLFIHRELSVFSINANTGEVTPILPIVARAWELALSKDGSNLLFLGLCTDGIFCMEVNSIAPDGKNVKYYTTLQIQEVCPSTAPLSFTKHNEIIKWSPDRTKILFAFYCEENGGPLYIANADGSDFKPLLNYPVLYKAARFDWSPDSQSIVFSSALDNAESASTYILNINDALQNPDLRPEPLNTSASQISFFAWQPGVGETVVEENPTPEPDQTASHDNLIAFTSTQNGNSDIYTMHTDGSGLTNLTNDPAFDLNPFWSPNGKQIAFVSDRSGSPQIYLMNADGSNIIQLTTGEGNSAFDTNDSFSWSPDGQRLIFTNKLPGEQDWKLYVMDVDDKTSTVLTNEPGVYLRPAWSPDGTHIAFISYKSNENSLLVVDKEGNQLIELTGSLPEEESFSAGNYYWSSDGQSLFLTADRNEPQGPASTAYEAGLDGSLNIIARANSPIIDWWNGTVLERETPEAGLTWLRSDGSQSVLELCRNTDQVLNELYKRSPAGNLVLGANCSATGWTFYWANPDGTVTDKLADSLIPASNDVIYNVIWSSDDRFLAFVAMDPDSPNSTDTLYILDIDQSRRDPSVQPLRMETSSSPSWQPVLNDEIVKEPSTPEPESTPKVSSESRLIAVTCAGEYGNLDICLTHPDRPELTNLTNNPATDTNPFWSPDGNRIAFESDRSGISQIYLMDTDGSNVVQLTTDEAAHYLPVNVDGITYPWSPEGNRILVLQGHPDEQTSTLISQNIKDGDQISLATGQLYINGISWSPGGNYVGYLLDVSTDSPPLDPGIQVMDANGNNVKSLEKVIPHTERMDSRYRWSADGTSIIFSATRSDPSLAAIATIVYEYDLRNDTLLPKEDLKEIGDWEEAQYLVTEFRTSERSGLISVRQYPDGNGSLLDVDDQCLEFDIRRSPLDNNFAIAASCPENHFRLYWENSEKTLTKQLLDLSLYNQDSGTSGFVWSPDEKYIAINVAGENNITNMYIVNVKAILNNESLATLHETLSDGTEIYATNNPVQVTLGGGSALNYGAPSWQPIP